MSEGRTAGGAAHRVGTGTTRLVRAWRALPHEPRLAAYASLALFLTLFLPWYQLTLIATTTTARLQSGSVTVTGWGAFSFVEAAVLLVAAGVLTLLFQRAEGRAFHLPGGDGGVITAAGLWTCVLIVWRIFDKQGASTNGPAATTSGVEWGIFVALAAAAFLAYSGSRIRAAHRPEPPLPGEDRPPVDSSAAATAVWPTPRPSDGTRAGRPRRQRAALKLRPRPNAAAVRAPMACPPSRRSSLAATDRPRRRAAPIRSPPIDRPARRCARRAADLPAARPGRRPRPRRRPRPYERARPAVEKPPRPRLHPTGPAGAPPPTSCSSA